MKQIGFLFSKKSTPTPEEQAAWKFISKQHQYDSSSISFEDIYRRPTLLKKYRTLWWHYDTSTFLPSIALDPDLLAALRTFIQEGGSLLLSLLAAQYTINLAVESKRPNILVKGHWQESCWAEHYPDIRGAASYLGHPILNRFGRGVFTWSPKINDPYSACYYDGVFPEAGKIVGVERQYIKLAESRRIITEYPLEKGTILSIGAHLYFQERTNRFRKHLERFTLDTIDYLNASSKNSVTFWPTGKQNVQEFTFHSLYAPLTQATWQFTHSDLQCSRYRVPESTDQSFDVGGKRILVLGSEQKGISELWSFPIRIARDVRIGVLIQGRPFRWLDTQPVHITIRPESVTREFSLYGTTIQEITFTDAERPSAAVQITVHSKYPVTLIVTASIDLRIMWPLSEAATGSLRYSWDEQLHAGIITDLQGHLNSLIGSSIAPVTSIIGQYQDIAFDGTRLLGSPTDQPMVSLGFTLSLTPPHQSATVGFAGSTVLKEAIASYKRIIADPAKRLREQVDNVRSLWEHSPSIDTPDSRFNEAYRWALAATERFIIETPQVGRSLMAGFGSSSSGWNGDHAISGRPGYAWYFGRDSVWSSLALLASGNYEAVRHVLEFLGRYQDLSGKVLHEATASGHVHYDAADSTPLYLLLMGRYYRSTGDLSFVRKEYARVLQAIEFCLSTDTDGDHLIENTNVGHGWIEGGKLFPVHAEYYLQCCWYAALKEVSLLAERLGKNSQAKRWHRISVQVQKRLEKEFWNRKNRWYNFGKQVDGTMNREKTMIPAVGVYLGASDKTKAAHALEEFASCAFSADWGVRMVRSDNPLFNPNGYHYGSIWPLFTGWVSLAEYLSGRPIQAFQHLESNLELHTRFAGGTIPEVLHGETFKLSGVCPHQCWSETMVLLPIFEGMLGLQFNAVDRSLTLKPAVPPQWSSFTVKNIHAGPNSISFSYERSRESTTFRFSSEGHDEVSLHFVPHLNLGTIISSIQIGKKNILTSKFIKRYEDLPHLRLHLHGDLTVTITHKGGIAPILPPPHLIPGKTSTGLRLISEVLTGHTYTLRFDGKPGRNYSFDLLDPGRMIQSIRGGKKRLLQDGRVRVQICFPNLPKGKPKQMVSVQLTLR